MGDYYDSSYEIQCPICKGTKYRNPQMKLMVNVCGHPQCDACVRMNFIKESAQCYDCGMVLKRSKFRVQLFEDPIVEKEIDIRRKVMRVYNRTEEDFETEEEYNLYLEEIEEMVYNITNDINRFEMEKKIENYERMNKDEIRRNMTKKSREMEELERQIDADMVRGLQRKKIQEEEDVRSKASREENKNSLLQDLIASEGDASLIVQSHAERIKSNQQKEEQLKKEKEIQIRQQIAAKEFSSGVKIGFAGANVPIIVHKEQQYTYKPPVLPPSLPAPSWDELESGGYLNHVRRASPSAVAGGYTEHYACLRALQDFMSSHMLISRAREEES